MDSPKLQICFRDRIGFVLDISRVIFDWGLNILSLEIEAGCLFIRIKDINTSNFIMVIDKLMHELRQVPGVTDIRLVSLMPAEERESKIKAVLDAVSEGIIALNAAEIITAFNPAAENILKIPAEDVLGKNFREAQWTNVLVAKALEEGISTNHKKISLPMPYGQIKVLASSRPLVNERGENIGAVFCIKDMSEVKRLVYSVTKPLLKTFSDILGCSESLKKVLDLGKVVAKGDSTVLIRGESGTGKELFAQAIHMESFRSEKPFVPINCAALPESLLESELFGYAEGAFTGAIKGGKAGLIEYANNGTLFLDEIGELSPHLQVKLLRVLQEGQVRRIGNPEEHSVNVRIIAATNRNLEDMIKTGAFREDLYYRLNVVPIIIPPLRQRKEDIALLAKHLVKNLNSRLNKKVENISQEALNRLMEYHWPGNVRELENVLERAMILTDGSTIMVENILLDHYDEEGKNHIKESGARDEILASEDQTLNKLIGDYEQKLLLQALKNSGSIRGAAKVLGISHVTLLNKIKKYGIKPLRKFS